MRISEFEKKTGLPRDTIRYYESIGLLSPPRRSENGYKNYTQAHLDAVRFIEKGKAIGFSLKTIKEGYSRYCELGHLCPEFKDQLMTRKRYFEQRIKEDKSSLSQIEKLLGN